jgi:molybdopterin-guanine dinucleotide biosynthesis protein B
MKVIGLAGWSGAGKTTLLTRLIPYLLAENLRVLATMSRVDLIVVEGFKREPLPKIEVHRAANGKPTLFPDDSGIVGIATDTKLETHLPVAHLDDVKAIAAMIHASAVDIEEVLAQSMPET